jgi:adenine-specific DNA-methyltransferase
LQNEYYKWFKENKVFLGQLDRYKYIDKGGVYTGSQSVHNPGREGYRYDIIHPVTKKPCKEPLMGYRFPKSTMQELLKSDKILFGDDENKIIELKLYASEFEDKLSSVIQLDGRLGAYDLKEIFPEEKKIFDNVKPVQLIEQLLSYTLNKEDIFLDSFAGSGTTAHAVLDLNKEDGGNRKFILVEMEDYANTITAERVRRVIKGVKNSKDENLKKGLGGTFSYFELGGPIEMESILQGKKMPSYTELGRYVFYTSTGEEFDPDKINESKNYIGSTKEYDVYLFYKPDIEYLKNTALTLERAENLGKDKTKKKLVFAPTKYLDEHTLRDMKIEFCQLPFKIYRIKG